MISDGASFFFFCLKNRASNSVVSWDNAVSSIQLQKPNVTEQLTPCNALP